MGTQKTNLEKYLELWDLFEKEIETSAKLTSNTLSGFAKYYETHSEVSENSDYQKVYDRLKKMRKRKDALVNVRENTLDFLHNSSNNSESSIPIYQSTYQIKPQAKSFSSISILLCNNFKSLYFSIYMFNRNSF